MAAAMAAPIQIGPRDEEPGMPTPGDGGSVRDRV
jgi:hypothetical protein